MKRKILHSVIFIIATVVIFTITTFAIEINQDEYSPLPIPDVPECIYIYEFTAPTGYACLFDCDLNTLLPIIQAYKGVDILSHLGLRNNSFINEVVLVDFQIHNYDDFCRMIVLYDDYYSKVDECNYLSSEMERLYTEKNALKGEKAELTQIIDDLEAEKEALESEIEALDYTINGLREYNANAYNDGYNDGMTNAEVFKGGLITIFSAPLYVFGEAFNFEIFGVNIFSIIQFIITIAIAYCVIKFIR